MQLIYKYIIIKNSCISLLFWRQKSKHAEGGQSEARFQRKTTPFNRISWLVKTMNIRKVKYSKFKGVKLPLLKIIEFEKRNISRKKLDFQILMKMFLLLFDKKKSLLAYARFSVVLFSR